MLRQDSYTCAENYIMYVHARKRQFVYNQRLCASQRTTLCMITQGSIIVCMTKVRIVV